MGKFLKAGRVVICTNGRMAGKKAIIVKTFDEGSKTRAFGHALVAGVQKCPLKVTKAMSKKKQQKRLRVKPFVKYVNYTHMMPTRYQLPSEMEVKTYVSDAQMDNNRVEVKKALSGTFKDKFLNPSQAVAGEKNAKSALLFLKKKLRF
jgi:large subunit ribosomal protein L27e